MSEAVLKAHVAALDATQAALARRYKVRCSWCADTYIEVGHPQSSGICDACLEREFPEDAR
jgi:hypothetical protein